MTFNGFVLSILWKYVKARWGEMTDKEKQKEAIEESRVCEERNELFFDIKVDTSQLEKAIELIDKFIEKSEKIQSLADCLKENNYLKKEKQYLDIELKKERLHKKYCICLEILVSIITTIILTIVIQKIM